MRGLLLITVLAVSVAAIADADRRKDNRIVSKETYSGFGRERIRKEKGRGGLLHNGSVPDNTPIGIVGGDLTAVEEYPYVAALLYSSYAADYLQLFAGTIINNRAVLTAANCFINDPAHLWHIRVGSSYANSGGNVHITQKIITHPNYNPFILENDLAILHSSTAFQYSSTTAPGGISGPNYNLEDNQELWAVGWGTDPYSAGATPSEQLRHLQVNYINPTKCRQIYWILSMYPTNDMLCSGWDELSGRDQCQGNPDGPVTHNKVIVGVTSWGEQCSLARYPGVSTRVSSYTLWIQENA